MNSQSPAERPVTTAVRRPEKGSHRLRSAVRGRTQTQAMWNGVGDAWTAVGTLFSGIVVWGGAGYGLDRLFGTRPVLFVVGVLVGNFAGIYLMYVRYMRAPEGDERAA